MTLRFINTGLRRVHPLEMFAIDGWRFKLYGMSLDAEPPAADLVDHGRECIRRTVPQPACNADRAGVGFATIHAGETGDYVLVNWWEPRDLLKHHLFGARHPHGGRLEAGWPPDVVCCVWELAVPWFERNSWYRHVLAKPDQPDLEGYLADRLEGMV